ncbi:hypothetical protein PR048_006707 [Dryococelus australis]|uniref:SEFIR domain-containing protein n=1 Tax=Dryococelus australis TaxID=614101 RepID=A0ABQ9ICB7_9NEOP|nr:hypothetical protein PR048_006707 [Dryococelus australis]
MHLNVCFQEPHTWYNKAYERANLVMVVSSPLQHTNLRETIYVNVENIAFNFLRMKFASPNVPPGKFFCVVLPYCDERDLPEDVIHFRKFFLMRELDEMLRHIRGGGSSLRAKVLPLPRPEVPGGPAHYKVYGGRLAIAIAEATTEIRKDPGVCSVGYSSSEHTDSTLCHQSSTPEVCEEAETSQDRLLEAEPQSRILSPFYLTNVREISRVENGRPSKKPTKRRFFDESMRL